MTPRGTLMSQLADQALPDPQRRYGGEMDPVMRYLHLPTLDAFLALKERYPWREDGFLPFLFDAQACLHTGDMAAAERAAHEFVTETLATQPRLPEERPLRWWRRVWWWVTPLLLIATLA